MACYFLPDAERLSTQGYAPVAHVPVLFDADFGYCRIHNRYLRERARGEWHPDDGADMIRCHRPATKTVQNVARHLGVLVDWCKHKGKNWKTLTYDDILDFQNQMANGTWSPSGTKLSAETANQRADEATSFLRWAAARNLRGSFDVNFTVKLRPIHTGKSSASTIAAVRVRLGRRKKSHTRHIASVALLPQPEQIRTWLQEVLRIRGRAKHLACKFILQTGVRKEELAAIEEDQIPTAQQLDALHGGVATYPVTLEVTKGGRPRTILVAVEFLRELRRWIDGPRLKLRLLYKKRTGDDPSQRLFLSDSKGYEGTPISGDTLYRTFREVKSGLTKWHPHFARHTYACFYVLNTIRMEASAKSLEEMGVAWIRSRSEWHLKVLRDQLGHISEETTEIYLRWLMTTAGVANTASEWHTFLSGDEEAEAEAEVEP